MIFNSDDYELVTVSEAGGGLTGIADPEPTNATGSGAERSITIKEGAPYAMKIRAKGPNLVFRWQSQYGDDSVNGWTDVSERDEVQADGPSLLIPSASEKHNSRRYRCIVKSGPNGMETASKPFSVTVVSAVTIAEAMLPKKDEDYQTWLKRRGELQRVQQLKSYGD